jgi:hypothetical protein
MLLALWIASAVVAGIFASLMRDSALVGGTYIPLTNDSLYHAHRILDVAVAGREFYQFDNQLHVPDGSWVPWPWAYDYFMAQATQVALWIQPDLDPLAFLSYVAPMWLAVNAALMLAATGALNLSLGMRFLAMLGFALSPLTQVLHAVGQLDHHFIELTFVLLNLWLGLSWFKQPDALRWPIALGIALGVAPAFHNGLFLLQIMPLACVFILWLRAEAPASKSLLAFCIALLSATHLILLPSEPYREGMFEFGLLSWFHFCAAFATSAAVSFMAWRRFSVRSLCALALLALILAAPMLAQVLRGASFLSGEFSILDRIVEAHSPYALATEVYGFTRTISYYSWLLLLAPVFALWSLFEVLKDRRPVWIFYGITSVFGLVLLLTQFRFHYFGSFALITIGLVIVERARDHYGWHRGAVFVAAFAAMAIVYQPALKERLFLIYAPGADPGYANMRPLYMDLAEACAADPGVVLASSDDGNAVLFHTDCSVLANNFILRPEDDAKIRAVGALLMSATPQEIRDKRPDIDYILLRAATFKDANGAGDEPRPMARQLLTLEPPPEGFQTIQSIFFKVDGEIKGVYARLYKIGRE